MQPEDRFNWTISDVAEYLGRPVSWAYDQYRTLGIPHIKVGQGIRFRPRDVAAWAEGQRTGAA